MGWLRSDVAALRDERSAEYVFYAPEALPPLEPLSDAGRQAAEKVVRIATELPEDGGSLFGVWSIADTDLAMMLWRLSRTGYELPVKVRAFAEAEWQRASVQEFVAKPRPSFVAY